MPINQIKDESIKVLEWSEKITKRNFESTLMACKLKNRNGDFTIGEICIKLDWIKLENGLLWNSHIDNKLMKNCYLFFFITN